MCSCVCRALHDPIPPAGPSRDGRVLCGPCSPYAQRCVDTLRRQVLHLASCIDVGTLGCGGKPLTHARTNQQTHRTSPHRELARQYNGSPSARTQASWYGLRFIGQAARCVGGLGLAGWAGSLGRRSDRRKFRSLRSSQHHSLAASRSHTRTRTHAHESERVSSGALDRF